MLRLVLGTQLDVSEDGTMVDDTDPRAAQFTVYHYLSMLQEEIVDALAAALPDAGTEPARHRTADRTVTGRPPAPAAHHHGLGGDGARP